MCLVLFATKAIMVLTRDFVTSLSVFSASVRPWVNINLNFGCLSLLYTILKQNLSYFAYSRHVLKLDAYKYQFNCLTIYYNCTRSAQCQKYAAEHLKAAFVSCCFSDWLQSLHYCWQKCMTLVHVDWKSEYRGVYSVWAMYKSVLFRNGVVQSKNLKTEHFWNQQNQLLEF